MFIATPMFPGMLFDAAARFAADLDDSQDLPARWESARALGWDGLLVPEAFDGSGGTLHDLAAIAEALGTHGRVLPLAERCGAAPLLAIAAATAGDAAARELVQGLATQAVQPGWLQADARSGEFTAEDLPATHWLALAPGSGALVVFDASAVPAPTARRRRVDGLPTAAWSPDALPWQGAVRLSSSPAAAEAATLATLVDAVQSVAAIGALITHTTTHLEQRSQFGVVLSSFQALRHRVVDMYVKYEAARGVVLDCLERAALDLAAVHHDVQLAHLYVSDAGRFVGEAAVQLHGAIGMSEELPVARLCKRLLAIEFRHGDALQQSHTLTDVLRRRAPTFT